ncbi:MULTISPECIES: acetolactate decarboxylase [unclassified Streptomyces]|uniref:acetolactate decarboxylase n=1 Tax=unclassified Streptomyces TaxID=2593676 RepID=UPI0019D2A1FF|nr:MULTISPECIES: acetolactate decarboxylase [unclassified Streptomyces]
MSGTHGSRHDEQRAREIYQTSTMGALIDGGYDGDVTIGELLRHGAMAEQRTGQDGAW